MSRLLFCVRECSFWSGVDVVTKFKNSSLGYQSYLKWMEPILGTAELKITLEVTKKWEKQ